MGYVWRVRWIVPLVAFLVWLARPLPVDAQLFPSSTFELSDSVSVDLIDSSTRTHLERVNAFLADEQWDEAVEALRQMMATQGGKLIEVAPGRYVNLRDYCHLRITALPPPALELYRSRVDAQAEQWLQRGVAARDRQQLKAVVEQFFASTAGDDALYALGELALEEGDYAAARSCWQKLIEAPPPRIPAPLFERARRAEGLAEDDARRLDRWYRPTETGDAAVYDLHADERIPDNDIRALVVFWNARGLFSGRLAYPRTDLDLADVRARLVLASILEGSADRAAAELQGLGELHPDAQGRLGGRSGRYVELLASLLQESGTWPEHRSEVRWQTFAGSPSRNAVWPAGMKPGKLKWKRSLPDVQVADSLLSRGLRTPRRPADNNNALLSYHPVIWRNVVLLSTVNQIRALDLQTGEPAWGTPESDGVIYEDGDESTIRPYTRHSTLGAPRFTLTVHGDRLFARVGSPVTSAVAESPFSAGKSKLVCLDLANEGKLLWDVPVEDDKWAFEGAPVSDGTNVYVAMRRSEIRPQAHVACYDAQTGRLKWRTYVCAAETPARGQMNEITHNLLTLVRGRLYFNTNLGAVAALSTTGGQVEWLSLYPRAGSGDLNSPAAHFYRDLTPCIYDRGRLLVAPSDSEQVFALDAETGDLLWRTPPGHPADAVHLVGIGSGKLIATGDRVWWIDVASGKMVDFWPDGPGPKGFGRGLLAGNEVLWPTAQELYRLDQNSRARIEVIKLADPTEGELIGGNLVPTASCLLIATGNQLAAYDYQPVPAEEETGR